MTKNEVKLLQYISRFKPQDAIFGIANVESHSGNCKITVGYFLNDNAVTIIAPKSCNYCTRTKACTKAFAKQIIMKYNDRHGDSKIYFLL